MTLDDLAPHPDMSPLFVVPALAVGWLSRDHVYRTGGVPQALFDALLSLLARPWEPLAIAGPLRCDLCRFTGGPATMWTPSGQTVNLNTLLFVPAGHVVYVAPGTVLHSVDAHNYAPPAAFQDAVVRLARLDRTAWAREVRALMRNRSA